MSEIGSAGRGLPAPMAMAAVKAILVSSSFFLANSWGVSAEAAAAPLTVRVIAVSAPTSARRARRESAGSTVATFHVEGCGGLD